MEQRQARSLAAWSNRRLQALWLACVGLLVCLVVVKLWHQWQRQPPAPISEVPDSIVDSVWRMTAESAAVTAPQGNRLQVLPEQHTDFVYSVVVDDVALLKTVLLLLGPPGLLTALWLYMRHGSGRRPPT
jgi:hypothetical protein